MNLLVGLAITNITTVFQTSGILRLKITITLVKIVEDMMLSAQKIAPFLISGIQILPKNGNSKVLNQSIGSNGSFDINVSKKIFLFPNRDNQIRTMEENDENILESGYRISPWII